MPFCAWKSVPTAISRGVDIAEVPVSFVTTNEFSMRVSKIASRIGVSQNHSLPLCF